LLQTDESRLKINNKHHTNQQSQLQPSLSTRLSIYPNM